MCVCPFSPSERIKLLPISMTVFPPPPSINPLSEESESNFPDRGDSDPSRSVVAREGQPMFAHISSRLLRPGHVCVQRNEEERRKGGLLLLLG